MPGVRLFAVGWRTLFQPVPQSPYFKCSAKEYLLIILFNRVSYGSQRERTER
jgi:hypothetical protein